ncbi:MAG: hypothetical protein ACE5DZ_05135, partial [Mariprofundus sp.]
LTAEQKAALTQSQLDERAIADKVRTLDMTWLGGINPDTVKYLTLAQIALIPDGGRLGQMKDYLGFMTEAQTRTLSPAALQYGGQFLTAEQITMLTPDQFASMTGKRSVENILLQQPSYISRITVRQIQSLPASSFAKFSDSTLQAMSREQVNAIWGQHYSKIKLRFTPEQQAWRP